MGGAQGKVKQRQARRSAQGLPERWLVACVCVRCGPGPRHAVQPGPAEAAGGALTSKPAPRLLCLLQEAAVLRTQQKGLTSQLKAAQQENRSLASKVEELQVRGTGS